MAFEYEITQHIATLSESGNVSKELNKVSYNGAAAKYDLRTWRRTEDGVQLLKGLTMTDEEIQILRDALNNL